LWRISDGRGLTKMSNIRYPTKAFPAQIREQDPIGIPNVGKTDRFNYIHTTRPSLFRGHGGRCRSHPPRRCLVDHHATDLRRIFCLNLSRAMISTRYSMSRPSTSLLGKKVKSAFTNGWMTTDLTFQKKCRTFCRGILFHAVGVARHGKLSWTKMGDSM